MNYKNIHIEIVNNILSKYQMEYEYYKNLFDPEHKEHYGFHVSEMTEMAKKRLDKATIDVNDYIRWIRQGKDVFHMIDESDLLRALQKTIRENMSLAYNYDNNKYIVMRAYRRAIYCKQILETIIPEAEQVTCRFFIKHELS